MLQSRHLGAEKLEDIAALMSRCFEDYVVPLEFTLPLLSQIVRTESVDVLESRIFMDDERDVAVALVCRRGLVSRLGAMGIVKTHRGRGIGREVVGQITKEARARGDEMMVLECIQSNSAAVRLYENAGFHIVGNLTGFSGRLMHPVSDATMRESSAAEMAKAVASTTSGVFSWQIDFPTVAQLSAPWSFVTKGSAFAAFTAPEDRDVVAVRAFVCEENEAGQEDAKTLLSALGLRYPSRTWRFPPFYPSENLRAACHSLGLADEEVRQYRMELSLR